MQRSIFGISGVLSIAAVCMFALACSAYAQYEPYRPLVIGNWWEFDGMYHQEIQRVDRPHQLWGTGVIVVRYEESTTNEGLENFWTSEPNADLLLWGFFREYEGWGYLYYPPIRYLDAPLYEGKTWSSSSSIYTLPDTVYTGTLDIFFRVFEEGIVAVPAGDFYAYAVGEDISVIARDDAPQRAGDYSVSEAPDPIAFLEFNSVDGSRKKLAQEKGPSNWFCQGLGEVQYTGASDTLQLTRYLITGIEDPDVPLPFVLNQNVPNPFNPVTTITFDLPEPQHVVLVVYAVDGSRVSTLVDRTMPAGSHRVIWDGMNENRRSVASGVYFYRIKAGPYEATRRMVLLR